jgi:hypothetical protein
LVRCWFCCWLERFYVCCVLRLRLVPPPPPLDSVPYFPLHHHTLPPLPSAAALLAAHFLVKAAWPKLPATYLVLPLHSPMPLRLLAHDYLPCCYSGYRALGTPNRSSTVKYKTKTINNCSNKPMK